MLVARCAACCLAFYSLFSKDGRIQHSQTQDNNNYVGDLKHYLTPVYMFVPSVITQHSHFYLSFVPTLLTLVLAWANLRHFPTLCDCERTASDEMKIRLGFSPLHLIDTIVSFQNGNIWLKFNLFMSEHFEMDSFNVVTIVLKSKWVYEHFVR